MKQQHCIITAYECTVLSHVIKTDCTSANSLFPVLRTAPRRRGKERKSGRERRVERVVKNDKGGGGGSEGKDSGRKWETEQETMEGVQGHIVVWALLTATIWLWQAYVTRLAWHLAHSRRRLRWLLYNFISCSSELGGACALESATLAHTPRAHTHTNSDFLDFQLALHHTAVRSFQVSE